MAFNKYFSTVALDIQYSIRYLRKQFFGFLPAANNDSFFVSLADCKEISNNISALNNHKTAEPNSIPTNIVKLLNKDMSNQLDFLSNLSLLYGIFPNILKTNKIIPFHKTIKFFKLSTNFSFIKYYI